MRKDALDIFDYAVKAANPYDRVFEKVKEMKFDKPPYIVAVGKAACSMAQAAYDALDGNIEKGIVITKYDHLSALPDKITGYEAAHPIPDLNTVFASEQALKMCLTLTAQDNLIFLISGGGSALFEIPLVELEELESITDALIRSGATIDEINIIRKHLSQVKGGRFANLLKCHIEALLLSDVIGGRVDSIASGPCSPDTSTSKEALLITERYNIPLSEKAKKSIAIETPKEIKNANVTVVGDLSTLCDAAADRANQLGYMPVIMSKSLTGECHAAITSIIEQAETMENASDKKTALIYGGEVTVNLVGDGVGGRNQEMVLYAVKMIAGKNMVLMCAGSDGTDGPTDAAGAIADGTSLSQFQAQGINIDDYLANNDSYHALKLTGDLIFTGATGTNVNDLILVLMGEKAG